MAGIAEQCQRNLGSGSSTPGEFAREEVAHLAIPPGGKQSGRLASSDERRVVGDRVPEAVAAPRTTETHAQVVAVEVGYVLLVYPDSGSRPQPGAGIEPQHLPVKMVNARRGGHRDYPAPRPARLGPVSP